MSLINLLTSISSHHILTVWQLLLDNPSNTEKGSYMARSSAKRRHHSLIVGILFATLAAIMPVSQVSAGWAYWS